MLLENTLFVSEDVEFKGNTTTNEDWREKWPVLEKEHWEALRKRMADELGGGLSLARFATEAGVSVDYLKEWLAASPKPFQRAARMGEKGPTLLGKR